MDINIFFQMCIFFLKARTVQSADISFKVLTYIT